MEEKNLLVLAVAEFIQAQSESLVKSSKQTLSFAQRKNGLSAWNEHEIIKDNINRFLKDIEFIFSISGVGEQLSKSPAMKNVKSPKNLTLHAQVSTDIKQIVSEELLESGIDINVFDSINDVKKLLID